MRHYFIMNLGLVVFLEEMTGNQWGSLQAVVQLFTQLHPLSVSAQFHAAVHFVCAHEGSHTPGGSENKSV